MDVRLPDGTVIRGVPDGISKAELDATLSRNQLTPDSSQYLDKPGALESFAIGAGHAMETAARGVGKLIPGVRDSEWMRNADANDATYQQHKLSGPAATMGEITGNVAALAVPTMLTGPLTSGVIRAAGAAAPLAGTVASVLAPAAQQAGLAAAISPTDRGTAAVGGAVGSVLGQAMGKLVGRVAKPMRLKPGMQSDLDAFKAAGVPLPTPGQLASEAADPVSKVVGNIARTGETVQSVLPLVGKRMQAAQAAPTNALIERAAPGLASVTGTNGERVFFDAASQILPTGIQDRVSGTLVNPTMLKEATNRLMYHLDDIAQAKMSPAMKAEAIFKLTNKLADSAASRGEPELAQAIRDSMQEVIETAAGSAAKNHVAANAAADLGWMAVDAARLANKTAPLQSGAAQPLLAKALRKWGPAVPIAEMALLHSAPLTAKAVGATAPLQSQMVRNWVAGQAPGADAVVNFLRNPVTKTYIPMLGAAVTRGENE